MQNAHIALTSHVVENASRNWPSSEERGSRVGNDICYFDAYSALSILTMFTF